MSNCSAKSNTNQADGAGRSQALCGIGGQHHAAGAVSQRPCDGAGDGCGGVRHAEPQQRAAGAGNRRRQLWRRGCVSPLPRAGSHVHPAAPGPVCKGHHRGGRRQPRAGPGGLQQPDAAVAGGQPPRRRRHGQPRPRAAVAPQPGPQRLQHRLRSRRPQPRHHAAGRPAHVPRPNRYECASFTAPCSSLHGWYEGGNTFKTVGAPGSHSAPVAR